jgi:hypothetical protein
MLEFFSELDTASELVGESPIVEGRERSESFVNMFELNEHVTTFTQINFDVIEDTEIAPKE